MLRKHALLSLAGVIGLSLALQGSAKADIALQLNDATVTTAVFSNPGTTVTFSGTVGQYDVVLTAGTQVASGGLDITNLTVTRNSVANSADTLTINLAANNYALPTGTPLSLANSPSATFVTSIAGASVTFQSWGNGANTLAFATGTPTPISSIISPGGTPGSLAGPTTSTLFSRPGSLYALNNQTVIHLFATTSRVSTTGDSVTTAVPEPASIAMALAGLPIMGLYWARRRRSNV